MAGRRLRLLCIIFDKILKISNKRTDCIVCSCWTFGLTSATIRNKIDTGDPAVRNVANGWPEYFSITYRNCDSARLRNTYRKSKIEEAIDNWHKLRTSARTARRYGASGETVICAHDGDRQCLTRIPHHLG